MAGRNAIYKCNRCGHKWRWKRHHDGIAPTCKNCGSSDVSRKDVKSGGRFIGFVFIITAAYVVLCFLLGG